MTSMVSLPWIAWENLKLKSVRVPNTPRMSVPIYHRNELMIRKKTGFLDARI